MSLTELLPAIRALPREQKAELIHLLVDEVTARPTARASAELLTDEELRKMFPPGCVAQVWFPGPNPEAAAAAVKGLQEFKDEHE